MKRFLLLLATFVAWTSYAQIVNIPDANFKNYLLNYSPVIDTNADGEIQVAEAANITVLSIVDNNSGIFNNLVGIEGFTNLTELEIRVRQVTDLDVSALTRIHTLTIFDLELTSLNI